MDVSSRIYRRAPPRETFVISRERRSRLWGRVESVVIARGMASLFVTLHELTHVQNLPNKKQKTKNKKHAIRTRGTARKQHDVAQRIGSQYCHLTFGSVV